MVTDARTRAWPCPTCNAGAGARCVIRGRRSEAYHAPRLTLATKETAGPQAGDPVYAVDADNPSSSRKYRVLVREMRAGRDVVDLRPSMGAARVAQSIYREDLTYDVRAGLWRAI